MRILLLYACAGFLVLIPVGVAFTLAAFPAEFRSVPLVVWIAWLLFSVWCALDAPTRIESLLPEDRQHRLVPYGKWAMSLSLLNVCCSVATLIYVGWWS